MRFLCALSTFCKSTIRKYTGGRSPRHHRSNGQKRVRRDWGDREKDFSIDDIRKEMQRSLGKRTRTMKVPTASLEDSDNDNKHDVIRPNPPEAPKRPRFVLSGDSLIVPYDFYLHSQHFVNIRSCQMEGNQYVQWETHRHVVGGGIKGVLKKLLKDPHLGRR